MAKRGGRTGTKPRGGSVEKKKITKQETGGGIRWTKATKKKKPGDQRETKKRGNSEGSRKSPAPQKRGRSPTRETIKGTKKKKKTSEHTNPPPPNAVRWGGGRSGHTAKNREKPREIIKKNKGKVNGMCAHLEKPCRTDKGKGGSPGVTQPDRERKILGEQPL